MVPLLKYNHVICLICLLLCGCFRPNCNLKDFNTYKLPDLSGLKTAGIYVSTNDRGSLILYENGLYKASRAYPIGNKFWVSPMKELNKLKENEWGYLREFWGRYEIDNGRIRLQYFNRNGQTFCKRWPFEYQGYIENDSTIVLTSLITIWWENIEKRDTLFSGENIFQFFPTNQKPDSSEAWFLNKRWYKKGMEENNAPNL